MSVCSVKPVRVVMAWRGGKDNGVLVVVVTVALSKISIVFVLEVRRAQMTLGPDLARVLRVTTRNPGWGSL